MSGWRFRTPAAEVDPEVLRKEEEGLITLMKERALVRCRETQKDYYECVKGRTISIAWACRDTAAAMNDCLHQHTNDTSLDELKQRWVKAGRPSIADRDSRFAKSYLKS
ncbi:predicted protein [Micromonas commoda]|jgi:COX assembly protein 1|uniref:COX assembly mitochondrial protein n=1 Tax=Micromonas commoda (strain RCC299 / NOUM17 / CCMP2709) TaxID=296587 RepID=C1EBE3_MICCC|nr:predicted protein [Micromonas commoda]ACO65367.1 predicted protein [Micromonas commoda]|eukprot:XP_002504109.1 predicted protein [Micromonas commoda]